jgi:hypothetical protein
MMIKGGLRSVYSLIVVKKLHFRRLTADLLEKLQLPVQRGWNKLAGIELKPVGRDARALFRQPKAGTE